MKRLQLASYSKDTTVSASNLLP